MNESNIVCLGKTWEEPILCLLPVPSYVGKCLRERASKSLVILVGSRGQESFIQGRGV